MLHRLVATLIVIFWLSMTGLLVLREMYPEVTRLNDVPVGFVGRVVFQHQQPSDLQIYDSGTEVGNLRLQPRTNLRTGAFIVEIHGTLSVNLPGGGRQRMSWDGDLEMNQLFRIQRVDINLTIQQGGGQLHLVVEPPKNVAQYTLKNGGLNQEHSEFSLDEAGFTSLLNQVGVAAPALSQLKAATAQISAPTFNTQTSSLQLNGETVSTFLFSMKMDDQPIIEAHLSQLGQVLRAQVPLLGYKFAPQNVAP
jgi:hypothetical protein